MQRSPIVYIPIELKSREFDSKITLAATLAGMGYPSVVGQQWALAKNYGLMPPGTILFKSFNKIHQCAMEKARKLGHYVVTQEEELLAQVQEKGVTWTCIDGVFDKVELVLADGQFEAGIINKITGGKTRVVITGNGRVDLLKPKYRKFFEKQVQAVRDRFGDFVLVNTNFGIHNTIWKTLEEVTELQVRAGFIRENDPVSAEIWDEYVVWERANIDGIHVAIRELIRRRPNQTIVIRPHPAEELSRWDGLFPESNKVHVIREGSHVPWTLACQVMLHTCCTTGFEAYVAGKPALSLMPRESWISDSLLTNRVNPVFQKPNDVIDAVEKILDGGEAPVASKSAEAEHFVWNCTVNEGFPRIAALLVEKLPPPGAVEIPPLAPVSLEYRLKDKFGVTAEECADTLARAAQSIGMKEMPESMQIQEGMFLIMPAGAKQRITVSPPLLTAEQTLAEMNAALQGRDFAKVLQVFETNMIEAEGSSPCWFIAGAALIELGRPGEALPHFEKAAATIGGEPNFQLLFMLAIAHGQLGQFPQAVAYAEQAMKKAPNDPKAKELHQSLSAQLEKK